MFVQHPDKTQYEIAPVGEPSFLTDESGVAEVSPALGKSLKAQGWIEVKRKPKDSEPAPAVEVPEDVVADDSTEEN